MQHSFTKYLILENNLSILEDVFNVASNLDFILTNYISNPNRDPKKFIQSADKSLRAFCILKAFYTTYVRISPDHAPINSNVFYTANTGELMTHLLSNYDFDSIPDKGDIPQDIRHVLISAKFFYATVTKAIMSNDEKSIHEFIKDIENIERYFKSIRSKASASKAA